MTQTHINRDEVLRIAQLAHLTLSEKEVELYSDDLSKILDYIHKLDELDLDDIKPTAHAVDLPTKYRPDVAQKSFDVETALKNAPERLGDGFGVPKIIE
ncbi:Asp-tRNA(Asn)/Glu-tRNA(Gln) amidotransferase subunit GatC [Myxococcota bacterium]|nr:Asp-tRNA(Asn)/Glu-tRNA(Gln) amidotransferase subunit GatC [Myxococcota bacterium]